MARIHGRFFWYDLMTTDVQGAVDFYGKVTGWTATPFEGGDPGYLMWNTGETMTGGVMNLPEEAKQMGAPSHWLAYTEVLDVEETITKATGLGATVRVPPMDIPNVGRMAILVDPQGVQFAVFTPTVASTSTLTATHPMGHFSWNELMTTSLTDAWDFYSRLFHWEVTEDMDMGPENGGIYRMYGLDKAHTLGGMMNKPAMVPVSCWHYYVKIPDITEGVAAVTANGGQVLMGPHEVPGGSFIASCLDPQGAAFALHAPKKS